jgi:hypothetical protein
VPDNPEVPEDPEVPDWAVIATKRGWLLGKLVVPVPAEVTRVTGMVQYMEDIFVGVDDIFQI